MIEELGTYSLSDFILFSEETYFGLFARYNADLWPVHVPALVLGAGLIWVAAGRTLISPRLNRHTGRLAALIAVIACGWTGWAFFLERYLAINPFASYLGVLFFIAAGVFFLIGLVFGKLQFEAPPGTARKLQLGAATGPARIGVALIAFAVFIQPFVGLLAGRTVSELAVFGLAPDPTAVAAMGAALADPKRTHGLLLLPLLLWCIVSTLTAIGLGSIEWIVPGTAGLSTVIASIWKTLQLRR